MKSATEGRVFYGTSVFLRDGSGVRWRPHASSRPTGGRQGWQDTIEPHANRGITVGQE